MKIRGVSDGRGVSYGAIKCAPECSQMTMADDGPPFVIHSCVQ
jgi:hypothetical protein